MTARQLRPCGTPAAYRRHLRHHTVPCDPCLAAHNAATQAAQARAASHQATTCAYSSDQ